MVFPTPLLSSTKGSWSLMSLPAQEFCGTRVFNQLIPLLSLCGTLCNCLRCHSHFIFSMILACTLFIHLLDLVISYHLSFRVTFIRPFLGLLGVFTSAPDLILFKSLPFTSTYPLRSSHSGVGRKKSFYHFERKGTTEGVHTLSSN